jgi:uncharacterized protein (DUF427 family)
MVKRIPPKEGQESVWDYPRPPRIEKTNKRLRVVFNGVTIADTTNAYRILETSHPPTYYIPPEDIEMDYLAKTNRRTMCEFKGAATYWTVKVGDKKLLMLRGAMRHQQILTPKPKGILAFTLVKWMPVLSMMSKCRLKRVTSMADGSHQTLWDPLREAQVLGVGKTVQLSTRDTLNKLGLKKQGKNRLPCCLLM